MSDREGVLRTVCIVGLHMIWMSGVPLALVRRLKEAANYLARRCNLDNVYIADNILS